MLSQFKTQKNTAASIFVDAALGKVGALREGGKDHRADGSRRFR